jgi:hypothetical protein
MAQVLKLKRTAVQGKVPTTDSLELGELAINTFDGKLYFEKDSGIPSVQTILVTDATITGSINLIGAVSASYFKGDGSNLTNLPNADVSQVATITASFDNQSNINVVHNFDSRNIIVSVYDTAYSQIIPSSVTLTNNNTANIVLSSPQSGFAVVAKGGHIVSGSLVQEVTAVATVTASFVAQSTIDVTHSFNSKNIIISVYDTNDSQIIPSSVTLTNLNTARIILSSPQSGYIVVAKGGHLVTATGTISYNNLTDIPSGIISGSAGAPAGTISGSSQLTSSFDTRYTLSGSISAVPMGTISGSSQLTASVLATTGSNTFRGTQIHSGSIIPAIDNTYDLGSLEFQWRDVFVSSGSLYIDGTKVLSSTGTELQITTDNGQSIKILEAGTDSIILQSADGDIQLKSSGGGNLLFDPTTGLIDVRGTLQIQDGYKITSSGGNAIQFGNDLGITGSINTSGTINGINLNTFSSSVASTFLNQNSATSSYETKGRGIVSGSSQIISLLPTGVISGSSQIVGGSGLVSGSSQIILSSTTGFTSYSSSVDSRIITERGRVDAILLASDADKDSFAEIVSLINAVDTSNDSTFASFYTGSVNRLNNLESTSGSVNTSVSNLNTFSASVETKNSTLATYTSSLNTKDTTLATYTASLDTKNSTLATYTASVSLQLSNLNTATSSYETKGRSIVSGSSQITLSSTTGYGSVLNQAVLTSSSPTFAGATFSSNVTINTNTAGLVLNRTAVTNYNGINLMTAGVNQWFVGMRENLSSNNYIIYNENGTDALTISKSNSNATFAGTITETSSLRYKENVETIKYGLDKVLQMRGVTYNKKDNGVKEVGVIAEEIYEVLPELVLKNEEGEIDSVSYSRITAVLIEAIKDLKKEIEDLKSNR